MAKFLLSLFKFQADEPMKLITVNGILHYMKESDK